MWETLISGYNECKTQPVDPLVTMKLCTIVVTASDWLLALQNYLWNAQRLFKRSFQTKIISIS